MLLISPKSRGDMPLKETSFTVMEDTESSVRTMLTNAYRLGYGRITVNYESKDVYPMIVSTLPHLLGFEILSKTDTSCVIESVTEPENAKVKNIFLKLIYTNKELFYAVEDALNGKGDYKYIEELETRIKKYDNFCRRVASMSNTEVSPATLEWAFYAGLMHMQRELYLLAKYLKTQKKVSISEDVKKYYSKFITLFDLLKVGYTKSSLSSLEKIHSEEKKLITKEGYVLMEKQNGQSSVALYRIMSAIRKLYLSSSPLIGLHTISESKFMTS